ncbi:MAG: MMPL family transporter [Patulibacter sp.]
MLRRLLAVAARFPRATLVALATLALAGFGAGTVMPVDGRLDRISPGGSSTQRAGALERASFGGDAATVLVRGDMVRTLRDPADLLRLNGLEGCLAGQVPKSTRKGPCATVRDLKAVQSVQGPATFLNSSIAQLQDEVQTQVSDLLAQSEAARKAAEAAAKRQGRSKAEIAARGQAAEAAIKLRAIDGLGSFLSETGIAIGNTDALTLRDKTLITRMLFAKGDDGKLGPKRRLAWLVPNRQTAIIQVNLKGDLSARQRARVTAALQTVVRHSAFKLTSTGASLRLTGLAPATQSLSDTIRRSTLVLGIAALVIMAGVLLLARRLRRRLLPLLVAAATLGLALLLLGLPSGALSLASVVALPVLAGLAVDQAVQAQLRLERRLHPGALRTLVIAGAASSASALALLASPFAVVQTVSVAVAAAILVAIGAAAMASAAALTLAARKARAAAPSGLASAAHEADAIVASWPPVRGAVRVGQAISGRAARLSVRAAWLTLLVGLVIAVAGAALGSGAKVQTELSALVPAQSAGAKELRMLQRELGFASTVSIVVHTKQLGNANLWRRLVAAQRIATAGTDGRCDGERLCTPLPLDELFGTTAKGKLPTDAQVRATLSALPDTLSRGLIDADRGVVALPFGVGTLDGARQRQLVGLLRRQAAGIERSVPGVSSAGISGLPAVVDASATALEAPGRRALLAALALLLPALVLAVALRAPRRVLVALVPPAFALGWSEFALWLLAVPRTPLTAALGVLVAAVAVEFSVLLGERFAALRNVGVERPRAITATLRETGGAVVISAGATIAGFGVLAFARIPVIAEFGVATALDLALVLVALVVVAPATWVLADRPARSSTLARDGRTTLG